MSPYCHGPEAHMPRQNRTKRDWNRTGQANLTNVGMATEKDIEAGMCGYLIRLALVMLSAFRH